MESLIGVILDTVSITASTVISSVIVNRIISKHGSGPENDRDEVSPTGDPACGIDCSTMRLAAAIYV